MRRAGPSPLVGVIGIVGDVGGGGVVVLALTHRHNLIRGHNTGFNIFDRET